MPIMRDIKLPGPDTRCVIFGNTIFKLKYKLSSVNLKEISSSFNNRLQLIQKDIKDLTVAVLSQTSSTDDFFPIQTDNLVIFPQTLPWKAAQDLEFTYGNYLLRAHPNVIFMLLHVLPPKKSTSLGKHKLKSPSSPSAYKKRAVMSDREKTHRKKRSKLHYSYKSENREEVLPEASVPLESASLPSVSGNTDILQDKTNRMDDPVGGGEAFQKPKPQSFFQRILSMLKHMIGW